MHALLLQGFFLEDAMDAGMLLPIFSLPSPSGRGDFSQVEAYLNFLRAAGFSYWQILPINPVDAYMSPYASPDLSAGDLLLLDVGVLEKEGLISSVKEVPYEKKIAALCSNLNLRKTEDCPGFQDFMEEKGEEAEAVGLFYLAMGRYGHFRHWPAEVKKDFPRFRDAHKGDRAVRIYCALSYLFEKQWKNILNYAEACGIEIVGDLPYYPGIDSVERWIHPEHFLLDDDLEPTYVSGVPGDDFSDEGQLWNSPVYDWKALAAEDFAYFRKRIDSALNRYHRLRLDHFRGYEKIYHIPRGEKPAAGHWERVPGEALFSPWKEDRRFLIEDLGFLDEDFYRFRDKFPWPGMRVMALEGPSRASERPQIYYTGNHDTDPLPLYVKHMDEKTKRLWEDAMGAEVSTENLLNDAVCRREETVFFQHGDFLENPGRINRPGTCRGNWQWMLPLDAMNEEAARRIELCLKERAK